MKTSGGTWLDYSRYEKSKKSITPVAGGEEFIEVETGSGGVDSAIGGVELVGPVEGSRGGVSVGAGEVKMGWLLTTSVITTGKDLEEFHDRETGRRGIKGPTLSMVILIGVGVLEAGEAVELGGKIVADSTTTAKIVDGGETGVVTGSGFLDPNGHSESGIGPSLLGGVDNVVVATTDVVGAGDGSAGAGIPDGSRESREKAVDGFYVVATR